MAETTYDNTVLDEEELTWADWFSGLGKGSIDSPDIEGVLSPGEDWESSLTGEATGETMLDLLLSNPAGLGLKGLGLGAGVIKSLVPKILTSSKKTRGLLPKGTNVIPESIDDLTLRKIAQSPAYRKKIEASGKTLEYIKNFQNNKLIKPILDRNKERLKNIEKLKKEEDLIKRAFEKAVKVSTKKTPKGGFPKSAYDDKGVLDWKKALELKAPTATRLDSKNKMIKELLTGSAISLPPLAAMLSHAKDWPEKLAEIFEPDPDMSGAEDMPIGQTDLPLRYIDPNYYEGETPSREENINDALMRLLREQIQQAPY